MALQLQVEISQNAIIPTGQKSGFLFDATMAVHLYPSSNELHFLNIETPQVKHAIPIIMKGGLPGKRIVMPQYMPYFSLDHLVGTTESQARKISIARHISTAIAECLSAEKPALVELNFLPFYWLPFHWKNFEVNPRITYRLETQNVHLQEIFGAFRENIRRQIKKSEKQHAVVAANNSQVLFELNRDSYQRTGDPHPFNPEILQSLHRYLSKNHCGELFEIHNHAEEPIAAALFGWDSERLYYLTGGVREAEKSTGAMAHVLWKGIQLAHEKGLCFDFEGSMNRGIEKFFSAFGGTLFTYFQVRQMNSKLYHLYQNIRS